MHGVGIFREIDKLPYLRGVELWKLGDGVVPPLQINHHHHGPLNAVLGFIESDSAGPNGGGLGNALNRAESPGDRGEGCG